MMNSTAMHHVQMDLMDMNMVMMAVKSANVKKVKFYICHSSVQSTCIFDYIWNFKIKLLNQKLLHPFQNVHHRKN